MYTPVSTPTAKKAPPPSSPSPGTAAASNHTNNGTNNSSHHDDDSPAGAAPEETETARRHRVALAQADAVLEAVGGDYYLDGFNLLGVIANPRGPTASSSSTMASSLTPTASYHGRYNTTSGATVGGMGSNSVHGGGGAAGAAGSSSITSGTMESTLSQVTEQIDYFNHMLEDWSRQILEDTDLGTAFGSAGGLMGSGSGDDASLPVSQLKELPEAMRTLSLTPLQSYLKESGKLAHSFSQIVEQHEQEQQMLGSGAAATLTATASKDSSPGQQPPSPASPHHVDMEIPPIFFRPDFDLTNPQTFAELLMSADDQEEAAGLLVSSNNMSETNVDDDDDRPISEWFPLLPQDAFGSFLDKVELSLLHQVRSKSADFFTESVRFAQLQEQIQVLLAQVVALQTASRQLQDDWVTPMQRVIPAAAAQRMDLKRLAAVLERVDDMLQTKSSLVGVLSAQDDLLAIEQIQYGRKLLAGTITTVERRDTVTSALVEVEDDSDENSPVNEKTTGSDKEEEVGEGDEEDEPIIELGRLHSLKGVSDQLNQYEQLVVTKLRDELVEIFLDWNTAAVSSVYATSGSTSNNNASHVQDRVREIMGALRTCRALVQTRDAYRHRLQDIIRMTVRTTVGEFAADAGGAAVSVSAGTTAMSLPRFLDCLDMLFEQLLGLLTSATGVDEFCVAEGFRFSDDDDGTDEINDREQNGDNNQENGEEGAAQQDANAAAEPRATTPMSDVVGSAAELTSKSVSELLRLRKEAHSLVTLDEMKSVWDVCLQFTVQIENMSGRSSTLRSTLLAQAKAFVERKHESNMSALVAALDSERWSQCEVSSERQDALTRLCSGRSLISSTSPRRKKVAGGAGASLETATTMSPEAEVEGTRYKVVWSCLLLVEMITVNIKSAAHFSSLSSGIVGKVAELLRLFNSRTTQLVLGAGAIHSNAKLKSINAKHLSLVTQCLGMIISILPHIRAALMAQMPKKQHTLLTSLDQIRREYADHNEKVLNKFVTIIGGIVEHGLAPKIAGTDFDARAAADGNNQDSADAAPVNCCVFLEGVASNTKKMHQVLKSLLPPNHLRDVFSRIFAFVDTKIPALLIGAAEKETIRFTFPNSDAGKRRLLMELEIMVGVLNGLEGVIPWDFTAVKIFERRLEIRLHPSSGDDEEEATPTVEPDAANIENDDDASKEKTGDDDDDQHQQEGGDEATTPQEVSNANGDQQQQQQLDENETSPASPDGADDADGQQNGETEQTAATPKEEEAEEQVPAAQQEQTSPPSEENDEEETSPQPEVIENGTSSKSNEEGEKPLVDPGQHESDTAAAAAAGDEGETGTATDLLS